MIDAIATTNHVIGIIGSGQMGQGIAEIFWLKKYKVLIFDTQPKALEKAYLNLLFRLDKAIEKNKLDVNMRAEIQDNLVMCDQLTQLSACDFVIEAIIENIDVKEALFKQLSDIVSDDTIVSTNTSSLSISELSQFYKKQSHFMGVHFFNPAQVLPLVELVPHKGTAKKTLQIAAAIVTAGGKMPVTCNDSPGFIVNRLLLPMINSAGLMLDDEIASAKDIDKAMCLGANFPMGPLALADFIGLDVVISILNTLHERCNQPMYKPARCFTDAVQQGHLGKKTGKGVFEYE